MTVEQEPRNRGRIGEILLESGMVTEDQLSEALNYAQKNGKRLGEALVALGTVDHEDLTWALGVQFELSYLELSPGMIDWQLVKRFPLQKLRDLCLLPYAHTEGTLRAVVADPTVSQRADEIKKLFRDMPVKLQLAGRDAILEALDTADKTSSALLDYVAEQDRVSGQLEKWVAALSSGELRRLVVRPASDESSAVSVSLQPPLTEYVANLSAVDVDVYADRLGEYFSSVMHLASGFIGIRSGKSTPRSRAIRAVAVHGLRGRLLALESIPIEYESRPESTVTVLAGTSPGLIKAALAGCCQDMGRNATSFPPGLIISLEARVEATTRYFLQAEIPDAEQRASACPALLMVSGARAAILDAGPSFDAPRFIASAKALRLPPVLLVVTAESEEAAHHACAGASKVIFVPNDLEQAKRCLAAVADKHFT